jgi:hypothetical protein
MPGFDGTPCTCWFMIFCFNISNAQKSHGFRSDESGGWDTHSIPVALIFAATFGYSEIWQYPSVPGRWALSGRCRCEKADRASSRASDERKVSRSANARNN